MNAVTLAQAPLGDRFHHLSLLVLFTRETEQESTSGPGRGVLDFQLNRNRLTNLQSPLNQLMTTDLLRTFYSKPCDSGYFLSSTLVRYPKFNSNRTD